MRGDSPYRRPDGREQRSVRTRQRIFAAALDEFRRVGFDAASVTSVARAAGVSRPTFYFHFPTKEHVLLELHWQLDTDISAAVRSVEDSAAALHVFVDQLVDVEEAVGSGALFHDILLMWARPPAHLELGELHVAAIAEVARRFLDRARGGSRLPLPPERSALLFLSAVMGYLLGRDESRTARAEVLHALVDLHLGIDPPRSG